MRKIFGAIILILFGSAFCLGQIRPGQLYDSGEEIYGPKLGVTTKIPEGWAGVLPMNTEVFLLMPKNNSFGQIYVMGGEDSYEALKSRWAAGIELDNGVFVKSINEPEFRNGSLASDLVVEGNKSWSGYVEAKCGNYGLCLISFLFAPPDMVPTLSVSIQSFMDDLSFSEPKEINPYENFDWNEFLGGKYMASYERLQGSKKESEIWLCPDGSFKSKLKRKGVFADQSQDYLGNKKGTWKVGDPGPTTTLSLSFKKLAPIQIELLIEEEKIYVNGNRFFFMHDDQCK